MDLLGGEGSTNTSCLSSCDSDGLKTRTDFNPSVTT